MMPLIAPRVWHGERIIAFAAAARHRPLRRPRVYWSGAAHAVH